ncbi:MAG: YncE family protein [Rhodanobacteraceae bacterium]|nr:MAG: YncE family protein [Rhodanobacteraceae bacterium]
MRTSVRSLAPLLICLGLAAPPRPGHAATAFYHLASAVTLPGKSPAWDYLTFDAQRGDLFIGRRHAGVTVYNVATQKVIATIADSEGANKAIQVPSLDRGYTVNGDGSTTEFELKSLRTIRRIRFGRNADSGTYEPVTGQLLFTMGDSQQVAFMDARTGKVTARLPLPSNKIEASAPDDRGNVFVAERDRNQVIRVDARSHRVTAKWSVIGCTEPTGLAYDAKDQRIFVGCRGNYPVLAVLNAVSGATVARIAIGRDNDGVAFDPRTHTIYASNGVDANLVVIDQLGPNTYALEQVVTTRPMARTLALDVAHDRVYLVTAQGAVDPAKKVDTAVAPYYPNVYFDNTFVVLTYQRH